MKLWCLFVVFLIVTISTVCAYSDDYDDQSDSSEDIEQIPSKFPSSSSSFMRQDRSVVKRSQRNANILYRYCRQSGETPHFCLKYAIQMIFATGH